MKNESKTFVKAVNNAMLKVFNPLVESEQETKKGEVSLLNLRKAERILWAAYGEEYDKQKAILKKAGVPVPDYIRTWTGKCFKEYTVSNKLAKIALLLQYFERADKKTAEEKYLAFIGNLGINSTVIKINAKYKVQKGKLVELTTSEVATKKKKAEEKKDTERAKKIEEKKEKKENPYIVDFLKKEIDLTKFEIDIIERDLKILNDLFALYKKNKQKRVKPSGNVLSDNNSNQSDQAATSTVQAAFKEVQRLEGAAV